MKKYIEFVGGNEPIAAEKLLLMTLWWLGKGEVLVSVADKFSISLSATHKSTELILNLITGLMERYIVWPSAAELPGIEGNFREKAGFPGIIGAMDCCNIHFKAPLAQQDSYIDRKMQHSIKLQGIATANKLFSNVFVGFPGSAHDARVFCNPGIFMDIEHQGQYHLVADSAYVGLDLCLSPSISSSSS